MGFSFRISERWLEILREEADRQGFSVNAIMNRILQNYCETGRWKDRLGVVYLTRPTLARIVDCCSEDRLLEVAKISGSTGAKDMLRTMGLNPTYNEVTHFIENNLGKSANWFSFNQYTRGKKEIIHVRHELGRKWSLFVGNQIATMFKSILDITAKTEIFDNSATLELDM